MILGCGDGTLSTMEECDDGNVRYGDGCTELCKLERTYCTTKDCSEFAQASCGDGILQSALGEECDDGNTENNDDCDNVCRWSKLAECGDGILQPDYEQCDQGVYNGDYNGTPCHRNCILPSCGDGWTDVNEECDDGNNLSGDSCTSVCTVENRAAQFPLQGNVFPNTSSSPLTPLIPYEVGVIQDGDQPYYGDIPTPARTPTGPGFIIFLASGAAVGVAIARRRLRSA
jgi:cysteine-rich repeat protein